MKAKESIMHPLSLYFLYGANPTEDDLQKAVEKQAEISFKIGKQEGMKEVVEWGLETCPHCIGMTYHYKRVCDSCWEDKLKE